jgi:hypothetical protein
MNNNALKWFKFAKQLQPELKEPYLGEAISHFRGGDLLQCISTINKRPGMAK